MAQTAFILAALATSIGAAAFTTPAFPSGGGAWDCFPCHQPAKGHDYLFTHYAP
jgi:hypothetical protein